MGTSTLKSVPITNLDATPVVPMTTGEGSQGVLRTVEGFVTTVAADAAGSTYRLVRVPTRAILKDCIFRAEAQGAGKVQLSVYYSDSTVDGTPSGNQGIVVPSTGAGFISDDIDCASAVTAVDKLGGGAAPGWNMSMHNTQLWSALGLATDPGGFFDIVAVVHTTAVTTGAARIGVSVGFVD